MTAPPEAAAERGAWDRRFWPATAVLALVGFLGRLLYLVASGVDHESTFRQGDAFWYSSVAIATADGHAFTNPFFGVPTADHPPITVVVLTPVSWLFGSSTFAQRLAMVVVGAATIAVVAAAGRRLAGPRVGLVAAALCAASPALWVNDVLIMSETLTALAVAVVLLLGIRLAREPTMGRAVALGAVCGLAALTRAETGLYLPLLVWPTLALARDVELRRRVARIAAATAATAAVMAPWSIYNLTRFDEPVPISTNDGLTLLGANCDATYGGEILGGWVIDPCISDFWAHMDDRKKPGPDSFPPGEPCPDTSQHRPPCWDAATVSKLMRAEGLRYARHHLGDLPKVVYARNGRVWGWYRLDQAVGTGVAEGRVRWVTRLGYYAAWAMVPLSAVGAVALRRRRISLLPFGASLAIVVLVSTLFYGLARFRIPWDVAACLLSAV
ncbi:MAG: glycosyltransferase family 39 protein, partial [Acidimicrobiales bacterium]|nr:glycosyltransferase family 39 protein [Acidimicrobiales bacterium]